MRKTKPVAERFWPKVDRRSPVECWPWLAAVRKKGEGYGAFYFEGRHQPASKVAYILCRGPVARGQVVCHRCDNPSCCNPDHLFLGTPQDNDADRVAKGRQARGSRNGFAKLTERQVWAIRRLRSIGAKPQWLSEWFGITAVHVWSLCNRDSYWRHVDHAEMARQARDEWNARQQA